MGERTDARGAAVAVAERVRRGLTPLTLLVVLCLALGSTTVVLARSNGPQRSPALCGPGDQNHEPGTQGAVPFGVTPSWDCGVRPVGFVKGANGAMAAAGHCAYTGVGIANGPGVRVIDVSDPTRPKIVRSLPTSSRELLAAQAAGDRALLATRTRETAPQPGHVLGQDVLVDVWDIRTCTDPKLLGTVRLPTSSEIFGDPPAEFGGPAHNLKFNPSATKLYGSLPLHEIDLTNLADPSTWTVRNLHCQVSEQHFVLHKAIPGLCETLRGIEHPFAAGAFMPANQHEPTFSPDGSRLYLGGQLPAIPGSLAMWVLDMTTPDPVVISVTDDAPGHAIDFMTVGGRQYLLHSNEIAPVAGCVPERLRPKFLGFADRAWVLDITNERRPTPTSEIMLAQSQLRNCPGNVLGPSTAYHEVDDPLDTTYAVIGFESAGFRIFDVRDPHEPVEVAYFNHGQSEHTSPYIHPDTGHIWAADANGFWVLELEPQVRQHLGLG